MSPASSLMITPPQAFNRSYSARKGVNAGCRRHSSAAAIAATGMAPSNPGTSQSASPAPATRAARITTPQRKNQPVAQRTAPRNINNAVNRRANARKHRAWESFIKSFDPNCQPSPPAGQLFATSPDPGDPTRRRRAIACFRSNTAATSDAKCGSIPRKSASGNLVEREVELLRQVHGGADGMMGARNGTPLRTR
jgi:hypothetical protein